MMKDMWIGRWTGKGASRWAGLCIMHRQMGRQTGWQAGVLLLAKGSYGHWVKAQLCRTYKWVNA